VAIVSNLMLKSLAYSLELFVTDSLSVMVLETRERGHNPDGGPKKVSGEISV